MVTVQLNQLHRGIEMKMFLIVLGMLFSASTLHAFQKDGCGSGNCLDCHSLNREEVAILLKGKVDDVLNVKLSEVPGLWALETVIHRWLY